MDASFETRDFGLAAFAQLKKGCPVRVETIAKGRGRFVVFLVNGETKDDIKTEFLNSELYQFDQLVRRFKKMTY